MLKQFQISAKEEINHCGNNSRYELRYILFDITFDS